MTGLPRLTVEFANHLRTQPSVLEVRFPLPSSSFSFESTTARIRNFKLNCGYCMLFYRVLGVHGRVCPSSTASVPPEFGTGSTRGNYPNGFMGPLGRMRRPRHPSFGTDPSRPARRVERLQLYGPQGGDRPPALLIPPACRT